MAKAKYTKRKDGRYYTTVWDGSYNGNGTKHRVALYSTKSSADLEKQANDLKQKVKNGEYTISDNITLTEYADKWLVAYKSVRSKNTQTMYRNIIDKHLSLLDGLKITDTRRYHFQTVINTAHDMPRTCQQINITFRQIVQSAISDRLLPANALMDICNGIDLPKYVPSEKRALLPEEITALKAANFTNQEKAFVLIIYGCGLRRGEALALTRFDIDQGASVMTVNKSLAFDGNEPYIKTTKTTNSVRKIPIPTFLNDFLSQYMKSLNSSSLFSKRNGEPITKSSYIKMWESIIRKMNAAAGGNDDLKVIHGLTAHTFRHNYCSNLCYKVPEGNISFKKIAALMGDTEKMVLDVYNHIIENKEQTEEVINTAIAL